MPKYFNNLNANGNQLQNAVIQPLASDPGTPLTAQIWFNNTAGGDGQGRLKIKLSTRTLTIDDQYVTGVTAGGTPNGISVGGTALAPTVSMLLASASQIGAMGTAQFSLLAGATSAATASTLVERDGSGNATFNQLTINNAPVNPTDAVNLAYAQSIASGFFPKADVTVATTGALPANTYASGPMTLTANSNSAFPMVDGVTLSTIGQRILVKNEAGAAQANNGIYALTTVGSGAAPWVLTRATDFDNVTANSPGEIQTGAYLFVAQGTSQACTQWFLTTVGVISLGTTYLTFGQSNATATYTGSNGITVTGSNITVNLTGTTTLETSSNALRVKSSANSGAPLLSAGTGNEAAYGPLNLAGGANIVTGLLPTTNGGLGINASTGQTQNQVLASPNGSSGALSMRALVAADLPTAGTVGTGTYTKVTVDAYGRISGSSTLAATDIPALDFSKISTGIVPTTQGGTGVNAAALWQAPTVDKVPVVAVATTNVSIAGPGTTIDGVTMSAGQRVLLTGQTTTSQNGLWVWNSSGGAMTRPLDYPAASTVHAFYGIEVEALGGGTANGGTFWSMTSTGAITVDTTATAWTQVPFNLSAASVTGQLPIAAGGTGSNTASGARTNLSAAGVYNVTLTCDGINTSFTITHNLNSSSAEAKVLDPTANNEEVFPNVQYPNANTCTVIFSQIQTIGVQFLIRVVG